MKGKSDLAADHSEQRHYYEIVAQSRQARMSVRAAMRFSCSRSAEENAACAPGFSRLFRDSDFLALH